MAPVCSDRLWTRTIGVLPTYKVIGRVAVPGDVCGTICQHGDGAIKVFMCDTNPGLARRPRAESQTDVRTGVWLACRGCAHAAASAVFKTPTAQISSPHLTKCSPLF